MRTSDEAIIVKREEWDQLVADVDTAIEVSLLSGTPDPAFELGRSIIREGRLKGVKLARLLYEIDRIWNKFDTSDRCEDAIERDLGIPKDTFLKYSRMYRYVLRDRPKLAGHPIEGLVKLTAAARDGQLSESDWVRIQLTPTVSGLIAIRDAARGIQTSGHSRLSIWRTANGNLKCKRGSKGEIKDCGYLPPTTGDDDIDDAVARLMSVGVMDQ